MKKQLMMAVLAGAALIPMAANAGYVVVQDIWPAGPNGSEMNLYADQTGAASGIMEYLYGDNFTRLNDSSVIEWTGLGGTVDVNAVYAGAQENLYTTGLTGSPISGVIISPPGTIGGAPALDLESATFTPVANPFLFLDDTTPSGYTMAYSDPALNAAFGGVPAGTVRMVAFEVTGSLVTPGGAVNGAINPLSNTYVIAFEDGNDMDYNDLVVEVSGVAPVPPPTPNVPDGGTTVALLGMALGCCAMFARKLKKA